MTKMQKHLLAGFIGVVIFYLGVSFIYLSFNPFEWVKDANSRFALLLAFVLASLIPGTFPFLGDDNK